MTSTWNVGRQSAAQKMVALQGDEEDENIFIYTKLVLKCVQHLDGTYFYNFSK